ncbi:MAG: M16 family metallopeptidase [Muribaculaceae bacterium]
MVNRKTAPAIKPYPEVHLSVPEWQQLPNGAQMCVVNYGEVEVCRVEVFVGGGMQGQEKPYQAKLLLPMLAKGSEHYTAQELAELLDFHGAMFTQEVSDRMNKMILTCACSKLSALIDAFYDCITAPAFDADEFVKIRQHMSASIALSRKRVESLARDRMNVMMCGKGSNLYDELNPELINALETSDLRAYHARYFAPQNCRIVVSGRVDESLLSIVKQYFGEKWQPREYAETPPMIMQPDEQTFAVVDYKDAPQTAVMAVIPTIGRSHPDYIKLRILVTAYGGYFGSRLMSNIREEKGYTYGISAYLIGRKEMGMICVNTQCKAAATRNVIDEIKHEMDVLRHEPLDDQELEMVRSYMLTSLLKTLDTAFDIARYVDSTLTVGISPDYFDKQYSELLSITPEELKRVAEKYFVPDEMRLVLVGDNPEKYFQ